MNTTKQPDMTFGEVKRAITKSLDELNSNESLCRVRKFAEQTRDQYKLLIQTDSLATETDMVYSDLYERSKALLTHSTDTVIQEITDMNEYYAADPQQSQITPTSTGTIITGGQSAYSEYLSSDQPLMNRDNTNAADASVLTELAYAGKFSKKDEYVVAAGRDGITIGEYCDGLLKTGGNDLTDVERTFLEQLKDSDRYNNLVIDHTVGRTYSAETMEKYILSAEGGLEKDLKPNAIFDSSGLNSQMLIINTGDGNAFVAIEGTNGTTSDWANGNGGMAGSKATDEEEWYAAYLGNHLDEYNSFSVAGHSQGGHEAVSAVILQGEKGIQKCDAVYSMDSPNFSSGYMETYAEEIDAIKGKVFHYKATVVSDLFDGEIGENIYVSTVDVEENGETYSFHKHLGTHWPLQRNEDGSYSIVQEDRDLLDSLLGNFFSSATGGLTDHLTMIMGEKKTLEFTAGLMNLFDNNGQMDFNLETLLNNKTATSEFLLETLETYDVAYRQFAQNNLSDPEAATLIISHYLDEFTSIANTALEAVQVVCIGASLIPEVGLVFATVATAVKSIKTTLTIIKYVAKFIEACYMKKAQEEYERKKVERQAYIASNPELTYNLNEIDAVAGLIKQASRNAREAYKAYDTMLQYFKEKIVETLLDEFGIEQTKTRIEYLTRFSANIYCGNKGASLNDAVYKQFDKAAPLLDDIVLNGLSILDSIGLSADRITTVNPSKLSSEAYSAEAWYTDIIKEIERIGDDVSKLGNTWQGQDFESIKAAGNILESEMKARASCALAEINIVQNAAKLYSQFQQDTIEAFQNIKM